MGALGRTWMNMDHMQYKNFLINFLELGAEWVEIKVELSITFNIFNISLGTFSYHNLVLFYFFLAIKSCWIFISHMSCFCFCFLLSRSRFGKLGLLLSLFWFRKSHSLGCFCAHNKFNKLLFLAWTTFESTNP